LGENSAYLGKYDRQIRTQPFFCPVGITACCVGVDGKMRGCPEQPDIDYFTEGDILKQGFKNIWENGFKKYRTDEQESEECKKCKYKKQCRGGCWVNKIKNKNCTVNEYSL